jgi:hypothetical protein
MSCRAAGATGWRGKPLADTDGGQQATIAFAVSIFRRGRLVGLEREQHPGLAMRHKSGRTAVTQ